MIDSEKVYWSITGEDIIGVVSHAGLPIDLSDDELRVMENCLVEGFCHDWDVVARTAIQEAIEDRKLKRTLDAEGAAEILFGSRLDDWDFSPESDSFQSGADIAEALAQHFGLSDAQYRRIARERRERAS